MCCSGPYFACCFRGHVGACCKGQSRDFHFSARVLCFHRCELDGAVLLPLTSCALYISAQLMSGRLCRAAPPTHGVRRQYPLHGIVGGGDRRRRWRRRRWRRRRRVRWQRRRATMVVARRAEATATVRWGSRDRGSGSDGCNMGTAAAATVGGGLVGAACKCGVRWAWRTAHGAMAMRDLESRTLKICAPDAIKSS